MHEKPAGHGGVTVATQLSGLSRGMAGWS
jgi:hypothetical protein